jgi:hypothetical protein
LTGVYQPEWVGEEIISRRGGRGVSVGYDELFQSGDGKGLRAFERRSSSVTGYAGDDEEPMFSFDPIDELR